MSARQLLCGPALILLTALLGAVPAHADELAFDDSFGQNGAVFAPLGNGVRPMEDPTTVEAPDGDLVSAVITGASPWGAVGELAPPGLSVFRYDPWGAPDTSFGGDGHVLVPGLSGEVTELRPQADGSVLVLVEAWDNAWLVHLSPSGAVTQRAFDDDDAGTDCFGPVGGTVRGDGKAVVLWSCLDGDVAQTAGLTGSVTTVELSPGRDGAVPQDVVVDGAGRLVVAFNHWQASTTYVSRYAASGTQDTGFGTDGWTALAKQAQSLLLDAQGRIVVGTYSCCSGPWQLHRLDADGDLDTTFAGDGHAVLDDERLGVSGPDFLTSAPGGKLLASGLLGTGSGDGMVVLRLLEDGTPDETFGPGGIMEFDPERRPWGRGPATAQADGNVLVTLGFGAGSGDEVSLLARAAAAVPGGDANELVIMRFGTARRQRPSGPVSARTTNQDAPVALRQSSTTKATRRTCISRRAFAIRLRPKSVRSAVVRVAGKRVRTYRRGGRLNATIDLRRYPQATFRVAITAKDRAGRTHRETRSYRTCRVGRTGRKVATGSTVITVG